ADACEESRQIVRRASIGGINASTPVVRLPGARALAPEGQWDGGQRRANSPARAEAPRRAVHPRRSRAEGQLHVERAVGLRAVCFVARLPGGGRAVRLRVRLGGS